MRIIVKALVLALLLTACGGGGGNITVSGKVLKWTGKPLAGVVVFVTDARGNKPQVISGGDGTFSVADVQLPYAVSAVPSGDIAPLTLDRVTIANPQMVLRKGLGLTPPGFETDCNPAPGDATLNATFPPVGAGGNKAQIFLIAKGIDHRPGQSNKLSPNLLPGMVSTSVAVPFDKNLCQTKIEGKVVYIERDASGTILKRGIKEASLLPGSPTNLGAIAVGNAANVALKGTVQFVQGQTAAEVSVMMKMGSGPDSAYAPLGSKNVTTADPSFDLPILDLFAEGLSYRVLAVSDDGTGAQWVWSEVQTAPSNALTLTLPSKGASVSPSGDTTGGNVTPTFAYNPVSGMNLYSTIFIGASDVWTGITPQTSIKLPALSAPARISLNTAYNWIPLTAINVRGASADNGSDKMLDGRAIQHSLLGIDAVWEPDLIASGSISFKQTAFKILP